MADLSTIESGSLKGVLEAMLLVSSDPVSAAELAAVLQVAPGEGLKNHLPRQTACDHSLPREG